MKNATVAILTLAFAAGAFAQETNEARTARLAELRNNNARYSALSSRLLQPMATQPMAINLSCPQSIYFSSGISGAQIQWLCDLNRNGIADVVGTFWGGGNSGRVSAMASIGGYLYAHDGNSSILRFTDTNSDGVADREPDEVLAGAAYTESILPVGVDRLYVQDNNNGRLLRYNVGVDSATVINKNLPKLGQNIAGTQVSLVLRMLFAVDQGENAVKMFPLDASGNVLANQGRAIYKGDRITSIAVDENAGMLFVLMAGECITAPQPPGVQFTDSTPAMCGPGKLVSFRFLPTPFSQGSDEVVLTNSNFMFNVEYSTQAHSMVAVSGKVYVVVFGGNQNQYGGRSQIIVSYDYTGKPAENQVGVVYADQTKLGDGFITSLMTFSGGPVLPTQQAVSVSQ